MQPGIPQDTAVRVYRRYLRLEPTHAEEYIAYLKSKVVFSSQQGNMPGCVRRTVLLPIIS